MRYEITVETQTWANENGEEFTVYSVSLELPEEYGCTSPWEKNLFDALFWCAKAAEEMSNGDYCEYYTVADEMAKRFPQYEGRFALPF